VDRTDEHHEKEHRMFANTKAFSGFAGPYIAWFKDPAGNILAVLQER
jgi:hypothetical protein